MPVSSLRSEGVIALLLAVVLLAVPLGSVEHAVAASLPAPVETLPEDASETVPEDVAGDEPRPGDISVDLPEPDHGGTDAEESAGEAPGAADAEHLGTDDVLEMVPDDLPGDSTVQQDDADAPGADDVHESPHSDDSLHGEDSLYGERAARDSRWTSVPSTTTVSEGATWNARLGYTNPSFAGGQMHLERLDGTGWGGAAPAWVQVGTQPISALGANSFTWSIPGFGPADGAVYRFRAEHGAWATGSTSSQFTLSVRRSAPVVTRSPADREESQGASAQFVVTTPESRTAVQWQHYVAGGWEDLPGEVERTLTVPAVTVGLQGRLYRATLWNPSQSQFEVASTVVASGAATLVVRTPPQITQHPPLTRPALPGQTTTFVAAASAVGTAPMTVRWEQSTDGGGSWVPSPGASAQTTSFTTPVLTLADDGTLYRAVFDNGEGPPVATREVRLVVQDGQITFTEQPRPVITTLGPDAGPAFSASFQARIELNGDRVLRYVWERSVDGGLTWEEASVTETSSFIITNYFERTISEEKDGWMFQVTAVGERSRATSDAVTLTVRRQMSITEHPADASGVEHGGATFTASASGFPAPTVQWQRSDGDGWSNIQGATHSTLVLDNLTLADDGAQVKAVFTNTTGSRETSPATLSVALAPPVITVQPTDQLSVEGGMAVFDASYLDSGQDTTVQWQFSTDGTDTFPDVPGNVGPDGAQTLPLTIDPVRAEMDGWRYRVQLTNEAGSSWSEPATLRLAAAIPEATGRAVAGSEVEVEVRGPAQVVRGTMEITAPQGTRIVSARTDGQPGLVVSEDGLSATSEDGIVGWWGAGGGTAWVTLHVDEAHDPGSVLGGGRARVVDGGTVVAQGAVSVTVLGVPEITLQPVGTAVLEPAAAQFSAEATGYPAPTVRWRTSTDGGTTWEIVEGATDTTLDTGATDRSMTGTLFQAVFSNEADEWVETDAGTLRVLHDVTATLRVTPRVQMVDALPAH